MQTYNYFSFQTNAQQYSVYYELNVTELYLKLFHDN